MFSAHRRNLLLGLGGVTFVVGIALLSFGIYSALNPGDGNPPVSAAPVVSVADFLKSPTPVPTQSDQPPTPTPLPPLGDGAYNIVIDKIGVDAPVETFGLDDQQVPEVPTGADAGQIVAWYDFTSKPGTGRWVVSSTVP